MLRKTRFYHNHDDSAGGGGMAPRELDPAQESLSQALRAGFNVLRVIIVVLLAAYFLSGWFQVDAGEQGLIVRLGELCENRDGTPIFGEGVHISWPDPIDEKIRIKPRTYKAKIFAFCFPLKEEDARKELDQIDLSESAPYVDKLKPGVHGTMLTGDRNLSHGVFSIEYRIKDAALFVQNVGEKPADFEQLLRMLAENVIVRTVAGMPVERVIRTQTGEAEGDFTVAIKRRLVAELERFHTGVDIINVVAKTVEPKRVRNAFLEVTKAKSERKQKESEAKQEANRILSKAAGPRDLYEKLMTAIKAYGAAQTAGVDTERLEQLRLEVDSQLGEAEGEVAVRLRRAASRANEIRERVQQEYERFLDYREMYLKYPELTVVRLWVRMRDEIMGSPDNEIFFVPEAGEIEIITNRDLQKQVEADLQRYRNRYKTGD